VSIDKDYVFISPKKVILFDYETSRIIYEKDDKNNQVSLIRIGFEEKHEFSLVWDERIHNVQCYLVFGLYKYFCEFSSNTKNYKWFWEIRKVISESYDIVDYGFFKIFDCQLELCVLYVIMNFRNPKIKKFLLITCAELSFSNKIIEMEYFGLNSIINISPDYYLHVFFFLILYPDSFNTIDYTKLREMKPDQQLFVSLLSKSGKRITNPNFPTALASILDPNLIIHPKCRSEALRELKLHTSKIKYILSQRNIMIEHQSEIASIYIAFGIDSAYDLLKVGYKELDFKQGRLSVGALFKSSKGNETLTDQFIGMINKIINLYNNVQRIIKITEKESQLIQNDINFILKDLYNIVTEFIKLHFKDQKEFVIIDYLKKKSEMYYLHVTTLENSIVQSFPDQDLLMRLQNSELNFKRPTYKNGITPNDLLKSMIE